MSNQSKTVEYSLSLNNKKYLYKLTKISETLTQVECSSAWISQVFENEDLPELLLNLPDYILEKEAEKQKEKTTFIQIRVSVSEKNAIKKRALKQGYKNVSGYLKDVALV